MLMALVLEAVVLEKLESPSGTPSGCYAASPLGSGYGTPANRVTSFSYSLIQLVVGGGGTAGGGASVSRGT